MVVFSGLAATARLPRQDAGAGPRAARHRRRATAPPLPQTGRPARPPRPPHEAVQVSEMISTKVPSEVAQHFLSTGTRPPDTSRCWPRSSTRGRKTGNWRGRETTHSAKMPTQLWLLKCVPRSALLTPWPAVSPPQNLVRQQLLHSRKALQDSLTKAA